MDKDQQKEFDRRLKLEEEAHQFVVKLCEAKKVKLTLRQNGKTGHCEIPEIWTFEEPILLSESELGELESFSVINYEKTIDADGNCRITKFSRGAGWVVYELESGQSYFNE